MTNAPASAHIVTAALDTVEHRRCAALRWNDHYCRWEGNLHFRAGTVGVYLVTNPRLDEPGQPHTLICATSGDVRIGCLWKYPSGAFIGRINTLTPIALFAVENEAAGRFIIQRRRLKIKPLDNPAAAVTLEFTPYPPGEMYVA